jgi:putative CRISPR-associated protein (TIGR02619 family)
MKNLIISTVGTSLLTNPTEKEIQNLLYKYSNCNESECPDEIKNLIEELFPKTLQKLYSSDAHSLRRLSAELNGIMGIYNESLSDHNNDIHFLICTDTYQGRKSAEVIKEFLNKHNIPAEIIQPKKLSTKNKDDFSEGVKQLLKWFDETIYGYKKSAYQVIFNLTGGFKSLQGYLNTIGMFYADKIIYIFESDQAELIEIPRLPIQIDLEPFKENKEKILLLNANKIYDARDFVKFPESAFDSIEGKLILSVWGEVIWNKVKYDLFDELPELPFIEYHNNFIEKYKDIVDKKFRIKLLETISKVSVILEESNGNTSNLSKGGIQFSPLESQTFDGEKVYHFRIDLGIRTNCVKTGNKLLLLDFGTHDQTQR